MTPYHGTTPLPLSHQDATAPHPPGERFELPARAAAVPAARYLVHHRLGQWGVPEPVIETAQLVVSELVTNALLHTHSGCIVCRLEARGPQVRVEVADEGPGLGEPAGGEPLMLTEHDEEHGRGLVLLDALTEKWGVIARYRGTGCTVWAEMGPGGLD